MCGVAGGLTDDRVLRVQGLASSQLFDREQPDGPANRRISIIVMNREAEDRMFRTGVEPDAAAAPAPGVELPAPVEPIVLAPSTSPPAAR